MKPPGVAAWKSGGVEGNVDIARSSFLDRRPPHRCRSSPSACCNRSTVIAVRHGLPAAAAAWGGRQPSLVQPSFSAKARQTTAAATAADGVFMAGAATMEDVYDLLADRIVQQLQQREPGAGKLMIGVAGVPGSGKTCLVKAVCERLNQRGTPAVNVPMDGFHYFRSQLDQMPNPLIAHARRGAEWTFDASAYQACLADIKRTGHGVAPSFDHGVGDPAPGDIAVESHHAVVLSEGNYLLLAAEPWWRLSQVFDECWFLECDLDEAMRRVYARQTGNGVAAERAQLRVASNDRPNAEQVDTTRGRAAVVVPTLPLS